MFYIILLLLVLIDIYAFQAFRVVLPNKWVYSTYWLITFIIYGTIAAAIIGDPRSWHQTFRTIITMLFIATFLFKAVTLFFVALDDLVRIGKWLSSSFSTTDSPTTKQMMNRSKLINGIGLTLATIPFLTVINGMLRNVYNYQVKKVKLPIHNLPEVFEGFKVIQLSDIHSGSFNKKSKDKIYKAVDLIAQQDPDAVFFTGDLVNSRAKEALEYVDVFGSIKAKEGVFSVLGNHDYPYYGFPKLDKEGKKAELEKMKEVHRQMGWQLLMNEHRIIERGGHKLAIIGVENWSTKRFFPKKGDLTAACDGCDADVKLLLSHDPTHWKAQVIPQQPDIDATFSGHTHGFQFGINFLGLKLSPAQLMYEEWIGLYTEGKQHLYVNPGFGTLGVPVRVGFLPELTVFELTKA